MDKKFLKNKKHIILSAMIFLASVFFATNLAYAAVAPSPNPTTLAATNVYANDATINATNGGSDATGHSFWVSLSPFSTASPTIPSGVYSTPDLGAIAANAPFSATLSSITTTGVPTNLPPITSGTKYYFAAWSLVGGTWYPGEILSLDTVTVFVNPPGVTVTISALPTTVTEGNTSVITYTVANADRCTKSGAWSGSTEGSGSSTVGPLSVGSYVYTLTCSGFRKSGSNRVTITVVPAPPSGAGGLIEQAPPAPVAPSNPPAGGNGGINDNGNSGGNGKVLGASTEPNGSNGKVLGAETFQFTRTLRLGMKGDDVLELHKKLTALGFYKGPIDNSFGLLLQAAVKAFQKANPPLKMDGIVGPLTRAVLNK